jgi:hypothetical protein
LEIAARVGGANIAETVEAATGLNLWAEWASIEIAGEDGSYNVPPHQDDYAGVIISLARQEYPDTSAIDDPEIVYRLNKATSRWTGCRLARPAARRAIARFIQPALL